MRAKHSVWKGRRVFFSAFDGQTYIGRVDAVYKGVATLRYHVPGRGEATSYIDLNRYDHRLQVRPD